VDPRQLIIRVSDVAFIVDRRTLNKPGNSGDHIWVVYLDDGKEFKLMSEANVSGDATAGFAATHILPILTDVDGGHIFTMLGATMRLIATAAGTGGRFTVLEQVTPTGWGPPRHIHSREEEIFYILEGSYELHVGDERRTVFSGASAILPRHIPHGFRNVASAPSRLLSVIIPGGLEEYFLAVAKCSSPPNSAQLVELARPFGLTLLPPGAWTKSQDHYERLGWHAVFGSASSDTAKMIGQAEGIRLVRHAARWRRFLRCCSLSAEELELCSRRTPSAIGRE
jgi:mannose-6-phosphate isomerase-like protein (cupin superfamily)